MIYGLVGLPATGKTTLIKNLEELGVAKKVTFTNKLSIFYWFALGLVRFPIYFFKGFMMICRYRPKIYVFWNYYLIRYARLSKAHWLRRGRVWLVDEPPLQNIYSLMEKEYGEDDLELIYRHSLKLGVIVYCKLETEERECRKINRDRKMPNEFDKDWDRRMNISDKYLADVFVNNKNVFVYAGNNNDLIDKLASGGI